MSTTALPGRVAPDTLAALPTAAPEDTSTGLIALLLLEAWVWTASTLAKVISGGFVSGFSQFVGAAHTTPVVYGRPIAPVVSTAPSLFAVGAVALESSLAVTFVVASHVRHLGG